MQYCLLNITVLNVDMYKNKRLDLIYRPNLAGIVKCKFNLQKSNNFIIQKYLFYVFAIFSHNYKELGKELAKNIFKFIYLIDTASKW